MITAESCTLQEPTVLGSEKVTPKCGGPTAKPNGVSVPCTFTSCNQLPGCGWVGENFVELKESLSK